METPTNLRTSGLRCPECDFETAHSRSLVRHRRVQHEHLCSLCKNNFGSRSDLVAHRFEEHGDSNACEQCSFKTAHRRSLQRHLRDVHGSSHTCDKCDKEFPNGQELAAHRRDAHSIQCPECDFQTTSKRSLDRHQRFKHDVHCETCGIDYENRNALIAHQKTMHVEQCPSCDFMSHRQESLIRHRKRCPGLMQDDTPEDVYHAPEQLDLERNSEVENEESEESRGIDEDQHKAHCQLCDVCFESREQFFAHLKIVHGSKCQQCGFSSSTNCQGIIRHLKRCSASDHTARMTFKVRQLASNDESSKAAAKESIVSDEPKSIVPHIIKFAKNHSRPTMSTDGASNSKSPMAFSCAFCPYTSRWKHNTEQHIRGVHCKVQKFQCRESKGEEGRNSGEAKNHRNDDDHVQNTQLENISTHVSEDHFMENGGDGNNLQSKTENASFQCDNCAFSSLYKGNVRAHAKTVHARERSHIYSECGEGFLHADHYATEHPELSNPKPACGECSFVAGRRKEVWRHRNDVHGKKRKTDLSKKACPLCALVVIGDDAALTKHLLEAHVN